MDYNIIIYGILLVLYLAVIILAKRDGFGTDSFFDANYFSDTNDVYTGAKEENARIAALREASTFLSPHGSIWHNLKLSNEYCELKLGSDGKLITCTEKLLPNRKMQIIGSKGIFNHREAWNMFCIHFHHNIKYDNIIKYCKEYRLSYQEFMPENPISTIKNTNTQNEPQKPQIDINNCSEFELTELPGISIVLAKKIIKRREEIGGFKTTEDFFEFLQLKEHLMKQIMSLVKAEKMCGKVIRNYNNERTIDF